MIGQDLAKRPLALGVNNRFKGMADTWERDDPDPMVFTDGAVRETAKIAWSVGLEPGGFDQ